MADQELSGQDAAAVVRLAADLGTAAGELLQRALELYGESSRWHDRIPNWPGDVPRTPDDADQLAR